MQKWTLRICLVLPLVFLLAVSAIALEGTHTIVRTPVAPGTVSYGSASAGFDASNASQGYIMARCKSAARRVKLQITGPDSKTYTYNLNPSGSYETFALTAGNGSYTVNFYENVSGSSYALAFGKTFSVTLENALLPYLYPNQYVNYAAGGAAIQTGEQLAAGAATELEIVSNIYNYVISHVSYDNAKATAAQAGQLTGYLPDPDSTLASGKGICFDYAALMAAMLRTQNIPTRLEVGYITGGIYHAWITTYITDVGWVNGIIQFDGKSWRLMDPTFASNGAGSASIQQFIGDAANYSAKYRY